MHSDEDRPDPSGRVLKIVTPVFVAMAILAAQRLVQSFRTHFKYIDCADITGLDDSSSNLQMVTTFLLKGQSVKCLRMSARYTVLAFQDINAVFDGHQIDDVSYPVSCAAEAARQIGATDLPATMAAGLAGGIGGELSENSAAP